MTTPRRSTLKARAARPGGTIAKPKGLKPGAIKPKATPKPKPPPRPRHQPLEPWGTNERGGAAGGDYGKAEEREESVSSWYCKHEIPSISHE
jgi:hypothetical protein